MYPQKNKTSPPQQSSWRTHGTIKKAATLVISSVILITIIFIATRPEQIPAPETRTGYIETIAAKSGARIKLDDIYRFQLLQNNNILVNDSKRQQIIKLNLDTGESTKLFDTKQFGTNTFKGNGVVVPRESFLVESTGVLYARIGGRETELFLKIDIADSSFEELLATAPNSELTRGPVVIDDLIVVTMLRSDGLLLLNLDGTENRRIFESTRFSDFTSGHTPGTILAVVSNKLLQFDIGTETETLLSEGTTFELHEGENDEISYNYDVFPSGVPTEGPNGEIFITLDGKQGGCPFIGKVISPTEVERIAGSAPACHSYETGPAIEAAVHGNHLALTPDGDLLIVGSGVIQRIVGVTSPFQPAPPTR